MAYVDDGRSTSNTWGNLGGMVSCPYPGCSHTGLLITKVHCRMHHEMERDEIIESYGEPTQVRLVNNMLTENLKNFTHYNGNLF